MADLTIDLGNNQVANALAATLRLDRLTNPQPLYKAWAQYLEGLAVTAYRTETAPFGAGWPALKPATVARKKGPGILRESRNLFDSTVGQVLPDGAQVGSNQKVGEYSLLAIHQFGAPRRNIPARRVLPMDDQGEVLPEAVEELVDLAQRYILFG
ncbi:MAG: phage virion morphogenesis protein [Tildeniella torsiva UHER 1998/13D]|jgi:phage gpG-like protein|nr:phage virion morphogenesis protein [Tildeniella torsiva UHER 1998/13D]